MLALLVPGVGMGGGGTPVEAVPEIDRGKDGGSKRPWWMDLAEYAPQKKRQEEKVTDALEERIEEAREEIKEITVDKQSLSTKLYALAKETRAFEKKAARVETATQIKQVMYDYRNLITKMSKYEDRIAILKRKERIRRDDAEVMDILHAIMKNENFF